MDFEYKSLSFIKVFSTEDFDKPCSSIVFLTLLGIQFSVFRPLGFMIQKESDALSCFLMQKTLTAMYLL